MASALNPKTVMVKFLRDFLEITEDENIAQIKVFEKLQDSYKIISKYEVELAFLLCEQGVDPLPLYSSSLRNNLETGEIITTNLTYLTGCTGNWPNLKIRLRAKNLLSASEIQILDGILDDESRYYKMYEWIAKKPELINDLVDCLNNSNNVHIAEAIREAQLVWIKNKTTINKIFWNQMENKVAEYENNSILVRHTTASTRIYNEKSEISIEITKLEAEKHLLKSQLDELLEKLIAARQSEAEVRRRVEIEVEIEKPQLTEELNHLRLNIQILNTEKAKLESELKECKTIIHNQNAKLENLEKLHNEVIGQLALAKNNKLELEQQILKMNSEYELTSKRNYDIIESVKLENMVRLKELKTQLDNTEVCAEVLTFRSSIERLIRQSLSNQEIPTGVNENGSQESIESSNIEELSQHIIEPANVRESEESTNVDNVNPSTIYLSNVGDVCQESTESVIVEHLSRLSIESASTEDVSQGSEAIREVSNLSKLTTEDEERVLAVIENVAIEDYDFTFTGENNNVFHPPESGFEHKITITIESCKIDAEALKNSLRRCRKLRSLKFFNVEMINIAAMLSITMDLPSLESLTMFIENPHPYMPLWSMYDSVFRESANSLPKADVHFVHNGEIIVDRSKQKGEFVFNRLVDHSTSNFVISQLEYFKTQYLSLYKCSFNLYSISLNLTVLVIFNCTFSNLEQLLSNMSSLRRFKYIDYEGRADRRLHTNWLPEYLVELSIDSVISSPAASLFGFLPPVFSNLDSLYLSFSSIYTDFYANFLRSFATITHLQLHFRNDKTIASTFENIFKSLTLKWIRLAEINVKAFKNYCKIVTEIQHLEYIVQLSGNDNPITLELVRNDKYSKWECPHCDPECLAFGGSGKSFEMMGLDKFFISPSRVPPHLLNE